MEAVTAHKQCQRLLEAAENRWPFLRADVQVTPKGVIIGKKLLDLNPAACTCGSRGQSRTTRRLFPSFQKGWTAKVMQALKCQNQHSHVQRLPWPTMLAIHTKCNEPPAALCNMLQDFLYEYTLQPFLEQSCIHATCVPCTVSLTLTQQRHVEQHGHFEQP